MLSPPQFWAQDPAPGAPGQSPTLGAGTGAFAFKPRPIPQLFSNRAVSAEESILLVEILNSCESPGEL